MWKSFQCGNDVFLIKFTSDTTHTFYLTDLQSLWMEELDDNEMQERFQVCSIYSTEIIVNFLHINL